MDVLKFFSRQDQKYIDLLPNVLSREKVSNNDGDKENIVEKNILTAINVRLDRAESFSCGLFLLEKFVSTISKENLTKYFSHWMSKLTQKLSNVHSNSQELIIVCKTIGALIKTCKQVPELEKRVSLYHVKPIVNVIVEQYHRKKDLNLLNLLVIFLYHYPESCARLQASFNGIITSSIDYQDNHLVNAGAKCYSLLIRANERSFIQLYKDNYIIMPDNSSASCHLYYQINLCHYLHDIMNELLQNFITTTSELPPELQQARKNNILDLPEISQKNVFEYYAANINRFSNICTFLSTLLKIGSTEKKYVLPNVILHVVCRGLSITPINLQKSNESRKDLLLLVLPKMYSGLINILEALITSFQQELIPFAHNIQKLLLKTLEWTQGYNEPFRNIRILTYKVLSSWMKQTRSLSGFQVISEELLSHILRDISQIKDKVSILKVNKKLSKQNQKVQKSVESQNATNGIDSNTSYDTDAILQLQVLSTVESIVTNANCYLKQLFCDKIRNRITILLYEQYTKKISLDKTTAEYRLQLLKTLRVLELSAHTSSSTSHALHIFGLVVSQEHNTDIIEEARLGLAELRHVIYPTAPTLMLPLSEHSEETSLPQTLQLNEICFNQPVPQVLDKEVNDVVECKRARLNEDNNQKSNTIDSTHTDEKESCENNLIQENGNNQSNGAVLNNNDNDDDEEMILAFCDEQSSPTKAQ